MQSKYLQQIDHILNYMNHGVSFEHFDLDLPFESYIKKCYPNKAEPLLKFLPPLHTLSFLNQYESFSKSLFKDIIKEMLYSFVLLLMGLGISMFFIYRFEPSIRGLLEDYEANLGMLNRYKWILQIGLGFFVGILLLTLIILFLVQSKDLKIMFTVYILRFQSIFKYIISYKYATMLLLFLQFDMKTSDMILFLRTASVGDVNKWLSYHIDVQLQEGKSFDEALHPGYFDQTMIDFLSLGYHHQDVKGYLKRYCDMMHIRIKNDIKRIGVFIKTLVFAYLIMIVAIFYSALYMPLQLMEVL